jgi:PhnB protein
MSTLPGNKVQSYLFFEGRCEEALKFYEQAVGARIGAVMKFKDSPEPETANHVPAENMNKVMHSFFHIGNTEIMASDGYAKGNPEFKGFALSIFGKNEAEVKRYFDALAAGGKVTQPVIKTFFSPAFGMVTDKFGVQWMVLVPAEIN